MLLLRPFLFLAALSVPAALLQPPAKPAAKPPATSTAAQLAPVTLDSTLLKSFRWRNIGPDRGGRSIAASGVVGRKNEAYFGATGGGLWKTTDGGENWGPVTDGQITSASVGAVAVSESNPDVVYIGMGESAIRGNIMPGDGIYKSTDGGLTFTRLPATASWTYVNRIAVAAAAPGAAETAAALAAAAQPYRPGPSRLRRLAR